MNLTALVFTVLLSLAAGQYAFNERNPGMGGTTGESTDFTGTGQMGSGTYGGNVGNAPYGGGMGYGSNMGYGGNMGGNMGWGGHTGGPFMGPFVTSTTVTTVTDFNTGMSRVFRAAYPTHGETGTTGTGGTEKMYGLNKKFLEGIGLHNILSENDVNIIRTSWNTLKKRSEFAPKVFLRYLKAKPEAQKLFPQFANVPIADLPNNHDFLNQAYTCINSLNYILPHLYYPHPENCPAFRNLKDKYNEVDLKRFGSIWMTAMQEEMGNSFTPEVRDAWKKAIMGLSNYASQ